MQHCTKVPLLLFNIRKYTADINERQQLTHSLEKLETSLSKFSFLFPTIIHNHIILDFAMYAYMYNFICSVIKEKNNLIFFMCEKLLHKKKSRNL